MTMLTTGRCVAVFVCAFAMMVLATGCASPQPLIGNEDTPADSTAVQRLRISALTEFVQTPDKPGSVQLKVLAELLNAAYSPVRTACVWRFELYGFHALSSDPRGKRKLLWPEYDLTVGDSEKEHWKEFLWGYEFYLPLNFAPQPGQKYVLEATCIDGQHRYTDLLKVQY